MAVSFLYLAQPWSREIHGRSLTRMYDHNQIKMYTQQMACRRRRAGVPRGAESAQLGISWCLHGLGLGGTLAVCVSSA